MAGLLKPKAAYELIGELKSAVDLPKVPFGCNVSGISFSTITTRALLINSSAFSDLGDMKCGPRRSSVTK